ncbi:hypothetical protein D3C78_1301210 [compost metagenome]
MPTAARPLRARPSSARMTSTPCQVGISALPMVNRAARNSEATMIDLRPMASEIGPVTSRPMAMVMVEIDSTRLLWAAVRANARDSTGIIGCTQ